MKFIKIIFLIYLNFLNIYCICPDEFPLGEKYYLSIYPAKEFDLKMYMQESEAVLLKHGNIDRKFRTELLYKDYKTIFEKDAAKVIEIKNYTVDNECYSSNELENKIKDNLCNHTTDSSVYKMDTYCNLQLNIIDDKKGYDTIYIMYILFNKDLPAKEKIKIDINAKKDKVKVDLTYYPIKDNTLILTTVDNKINNTINNWIQNNITIDNNLKANSLYYILIIIPIIIPIIILIIIGIILYLKKDKIFKNSNSIY